LLILCYISNVKNLFLNSMGIRAWH